MKHTWIWCLLLFVMVAGCARPRPVLVRMECVVAGEVIATLRFAHENGRLSKAQLFDDQRQWMFSALPIRSLGKLDEVTYSSSEKSQCASYSSPTRDSLVASFTGRGDFQTNSMRLDERERVVERRLTFKNQSLRYEITTTWDNSLPERMDYVFINEYRGNAVTSGGTLVFHAEDGLVRRIEVQDETFNPDGEFHIVCHYVLSGDGPHDWSETEFYLPSPLLLMSAWSVHVNQETL